MEQLRYTGVIPMSAPATAKEYTPEATLAADDNRRMFDAIARRYDLLNRLMSMGLDRRWRERAAGMLLARIPAGMGRVSVLDAGCGTGDVAIEIGRRSKDVKVLGIDHSAGMLVIGARKVADAGLGDRITLQAGDAVKTGAPDAAFDGIITAFCFRNINDRRAFLSESMRVLKPGAPLLILELTRPLSWWLRAMHFIYNAWLVPCLGLVLSRGSAYRYLFKSIEAFPPHQEVLAMMTAAGFKDVRWTPFAGGVVSVFDGVCGR